MPASEETVAVVCNRHAHADKDRKNMGKEDFLVGAHMAELPYLRFLNKILVTSARSLLYART